MTQTETEIEFRKLLLLTDYKRSTYEKKSKLDLGTGRRKL